MSAILSACGGVFVKGSLAKERKFHLLFPFGEESSDLLSFEGSPSELCKIHQEPKTQGKKQAKSLGPEGSSKIVHAG